MKRWPDLNLNGDLPVGIYQATVEEIIEYFGAGTLQRQLVARRLQRIYNLAAGTGQLARFIVFGSFITNKSAPNDVDIFMLMEDTFDLSRISGEAAIIFHNRAAQNWEGASIFWIRRMAAIGGEEEALKDWQIKRDGSRRGIVEVIAK
ncbi:MAG TPA: hypothetical protein VF397_12870 [Pyrinomonadaceae bacterium]